ncbi:hypothetical protein [Nocardioides terrisoli]|uniref:hypothetical protein n=1 Tax=Nocardioides terrisoli TaxID=3388267 RepID=UPI00287BB677|nr:hypothetical protein [Nocardioides marmorisolisilvae]
MATRVVLHVGAMKSGTSFIQQVLLANKDRLAEHGILFPGKRWRDQVVAVHDLIEHDELAEDGPWHAMAAQVRDWPGTAIISMEFLGPRSRPKIEMVKESFGDADLQVVLTARDLARTIPSMWTESVQNRGTATWPAYLRGVRSEALTAEGRAFWRQQRIPAIAKRWSSVFGRDHFTLITVPPRGAPPTLLWERFCSVAGVPEGLCDLEAPGNPALDAPSAMVMRALNERLQERGLDSADYDRFVKRSLAKNGIGRRPERGAPVGLDERWVLKKARSELAGLAALDLRVVGDLAELEPQPVPGVHTDKVTTQEQLDAALDGLAAVIELWAEDSRVRAARQRRRLKRARRKARRQ